MSKFLTTMGEPLDEREMKFLLDLAQKETGNSDMIDIDKLSQILIPSDNIMDDLARQANE